MSLKRLLATDLPITPRHDRWLGLHADEPYPPTVAEWVAGQLMKPQRDRSATFSASATGRCERQQVLRFIDHPQMVSYDPQQAHRFQVGDWGHLRWQAQGLTAGWLAQAEVPVRLPDFGLTGTMDGITDEGGGFEFKTIRHPGFNAVLKDGMAKFEHILQVTAYMLATDLRLFSIIYESTFSGEWKEFVVEFEHEFADMVIETLESMQTAVARQQLPAALPDCLAKKGSTYTECPYRRDCLSWVAGGVSWPPNRVKARRTIVSLPSL